MEFLEFWSVLLTFVSMVDYTEREERLREKRKMFVCFPITSPAHHHRERERRNFFFFREIKNYLKFISLIEVCHNEIFENIFHKFCSFWSSCVLTFVYGRLHREKKDWEKKGKCFKWTLHHPGPYTERRTIKRNFNNI